MATRTALLLSKGTRTFLMLALFAVAIPSWPVDLGGFSKTYPIAEPDFLEEVQAIAKEKVDSGEWRRLLMEARDRAQKWLDYPPPVDGLRTTRTHRVRRFDPSITLVADVIDGEGRILFPAGTTVNPADVAQFPGALLVIDGRETGQLAVASRLIGSWGDALKIVLVAGSPPALMREWQRPIFFDQAGAISRRFGLEYVPALISQAMPADRFLTIEELLPEGKR